MKFIRTHLSTILISLAVGILLFYIQPILTVLGNAIVNLFLFASESFSDSYYKSIAKNDPYIFEQFNNYFLTIAFFGVFVYMTIYMRRKRSELKSKIKDRLSEIKELKKKVENGNNEKQLGKEEMLSDLNELEIQVSLREGQLDKKENLFLVSTILVLSLGVLLFSNFFMNKNIVDENIQFRNRKVILLPYVDQTEIDKLNSDWTLMKNSEDYDSIMVTLKELEKKYLKNK
jgi:ABC-type multidrug transport system fused ATPase/permease subunit